MIRRSVLLSSIALASGALSRAAWSQAAYPNRPVRMIVPYPAGSSGDIVARLLVQRLAGTLGQAVVVDNRAGGAGIAATEAVARAAPDGHTLLLTGLNHVSNVGLFPSLPFDTERDFLPISLVGSVEVVLVAHPSTGFRSTQDLIAAAKARPGQINFASAGNGTGGHLAMELFTRTAGIQMTHVPYRGATPALTDVLSGQVQTLFTGVPPALNFVREGKLNALLVGGTERVPNLPDVPTARDIGLTGFDVNVWFGVLGPAGMPASVVRTLASQISAIVAEVEFRTRMAEQGITPVGSSPEEFSEVIRKDLSRWPALIREAGIRAE